MRASYPTYKSTSIPWMPEMPEHWDIRRAKYVFRVIDDKTAKGDEELLSVSEHYGVLPRRNANVNTFKAESYEGYKLCKKGDLVINSLWAWSRGLGVSEYEGIISNAYSVFRLKVPANHRFFHYLLRTEGYVAEYLKRSKGIWISRLQLSDLQFLDLPLPLPPLTEQTAIANYLDAKSEQINHFIEKKQKLIALLKKQKQAVINELLEDKEGKWERRKLKYFCSLITKGTTPSTEGKEFTNAGVRFLKAENITENGLSESPLFFIDEETNQLLKRSQLKSNDILIVIAGATIGRTAIITEEYLPANTNQAVCLLRLKKGVDPKFIRILLSSPKIQERVRFDAVQSAQPNLSMGVLGDFLLPYPKSESERQQVVKTIEEESFRIDAVIQRINVEIEKVKELKQSLIAEVVTGRIKVA